jgi:hypothetical protein
MRRGRVRIQLAAGVVFRSNDKLWLVEPDARDDERVYLVFRNGDLVGECETVYQVEGVLRDSGGPEMGVSRHAGR